MADIAKTIEIIFAGTDQMSGVIDNVADKTTQFGEGLQNIGQPFADAAGKVALMETAILALGVAGLKARSDIEQEATRMGNALGIPTEKAEEFKEVAERVYTAGFGENLTEAFGDVTLAAQKFSDQSVEGIDSIVLNAKKIEATFNEDVSTSLSGVRTLMDNFGLSSDEAFDFIVAGYQKGMNGSGDFIESINEYSTQFANGGADAGQFFSVMESGFQEGMLGTDRAADSFKEFRVRIQDGSATTTDALAQIGLGANFTDSLANGEISAIQAFGTVIDRLNAVDDSSIQMQAGVGLIGTQFEDMGTQAALAMNTTATNLDDLAGKIDSIDPNESLGMKFVIMMRNIRTTITRADIWDGVENDLKDKFDNITHSFTEAWSQLTADDFSGLMDSIDELFNSMGEALDSAGIDLTTTEGMKALIQDVIETFTSLTEVSAGMVDIIGPIVGWAADLGRAFNDLDPSTQAVVGNILALGAGLTTVGGALVAGGGIIAGISSLIGFFSGGAGLTAALATFAASPALIVLGLPIVAVGAIEGVKALAEWIFKLTHDTSDSVPAHRELEAALKRYADLKGNPALITNVQGMTDATQLGVGQMRALEGAINLLPTEKRTEILSIFAKDGFDAAVLALESIDDKKVTVTIDGVEYTLEQLKLMQETGEIPVVVAVDRPSVQETRNYIDTELPDGTTQRVYMESDPSSINDTKSEIQESLDPLKVFEIETQLDIAQLEAATSMFSDVMSTINTSIEWDAKIDIAQIEADSEQAIAAFESIGGSVSSVTDAVSSMFSDLTGSSSYEFMKLFPILEKEQDLQAKLIESQIKLIDAQIASMERGDAIFTISGENVSEGARAFMMDVLKEVQIGMNASASSYLLGTEAAA